MKKPSFYLSAFFALVILLNACKQEPKIKLVDADQDLLDSISMIAMNPNGDTTQHNVIQPAAKGLEWKAWETWFKNCPKSENFRKSIVYLGPASTRGVGYIMSKDLTLDRWNFLKLSTDTEKNNSFIDSGSTVGSCNISEMKDFSINMLVGGKILSSVDASLGGLLSNAKKITLKTGSWRIESLITGPFMDYVTKDPKFTEYQSAMLNKGNIILTKVLKVSGFELEITAQDSISTALNATLQNGFKVNVVPTDTTKKIGFSLTFKKGSSNTVNVSSTGEISLFAQASKGEQLKN